MDWRLAAWAALLAAAMARGAAGDNLDDRIAASEGIVRSLQEAAARLYSERQVVVPDCRCSVHACSNRFGGSLTCTSVLGVSATCVESCDVEGKLLAMEHALVLTPPETDPSDLSPGVIESICTYLPLDETFVAKGPEGKFTWSYIGTTNGVVRIWPGPPWTRGVEDGDFDEMLGNCRSFDPRIRPWFIAASSGPKDVVIVVDTSGSMSLDLGREGKTRWEVTKDAVSRLLGTFGIADFVGVVTFNSKATALGNTTTLLRSEGATIGALKEELASVEPIGGTDFRTGLDVAFDILIESSRIGAESDIAPTSFCNKIILFLTDGEDCTLNTRQPCKYDTQNDGQKTGSGADVVLNRIEERQAELLAQGSSRANIFTFSMTTDADDRLPKMISCENDGSWEAIGEEDDPLTKFLDYTRFLAWGRRGLDVIWSNFYVDDGGLGNMTTAAMPVYAPDTAEGVPGLLVGVVGKDVLVSQLEQDDKDFQTVFDRIIKRTATCRENELQPCQLQVLRGKEAECPERFDDKTCYFLEEVGKFYMDETVSKLNFEKAREKCMELGGDLAEIHTEAEHRFLSGLAVRDGSWIGLRLDTSSFTYVWRWLKSGHEVKAPFKAFIDDDLNSTGDGVPAEKLWAVRVKDVQDCGTIDRRGLDHNVVDVDCDQEMAYICEFEADNAPTECLGNDTLRVDSRYDPNVPSINDCSDFEIALAGSTDVVEATKDIESSTALCDIGRQVRTTEEVQCCCSDVGCAEEEDGIPCVDAFVEGG